MSAQLAMPSYNLSAMNTIAQTLTATTGALDTHLIYFNSLCPTSAGGGNYSKASTAFTAQVTKYFGSYDKMITALNTETMEVSGAGWGWLVYDTKIGALDTTYTMNYDRLEPTLKPIINIDFWEHAFFLDTFDNHTLYLSNLEHVYNWQFASEVFADITMD